MLGEIETGRLYGSTHLIAKIWKQMLVNCHQACEETLPQEQQIP